MLKSRGGREENEKLLLSVKETCGLTGLSERTVRTLMAENDFTVRIGRRTLVHKKKFEKWLEKQFEFRREIYKSYNACCTAYNLAQEYVAIKAKREKITRQEAMEKLLAQRESEKTI